ncbi:DNA-deoxyinosine glycosylase [Dechloromonas sp. H13]|uniref:DNA-deoxyinosine glycosylase n=1 Tax=Dechloromonas sp. H13 TaxID=2570193 RepID=UPI00129111FA|nr:DNA-deoxyinosine glycosylase [Dechloromonas sp. H13]
MPEHHARSFPPLAAPDARVLILGSMPGLASLAAGQYYAHPRNAFWPLMGELLSIPPGRDYPARVAALCHAGIALWDVLYSCRRQGSLDTAIEDDSLVPNDLAGFIAAHPAVRHIFFNGAKAESCFRRHIRLPDAERQIAFTRLPSTSPAHAGRSFAEKLAAWQAVRAALDARP